MADDHSKVSFKQVSTSRRRSTAVVKRSCTRYKKLFLCVMILAAGFMCGHLLHRLTTKSEILSIKSFQPVPPKHSQGGNQDDSASVLFSDDMKTTTGSFNTTNPYEPLNMGEGSTEKKDMNVAYTPRNIFVNCGGKFPDTLQLFVSTYPEAYDYVLYSFISDESYALFYQNFPSHTLFAPFIVSTENTTEQANINEFASMRQLYDNVPTIDVTAWLKTFCHPKDFVIFKVDSKKELEIVNKLVESESVKWIDKFYTTNHDGDTLELFRNKFNASGLQVLTWNNEERTYSDFDHVNAPRIPHGGPTYMTSCFIPQDTEQFALLLYVEQFTPKIEETLNILQTYGQGRNVAVSIFLPADFYQKYRLHSLYSTYTMGLYLRSVEHVSNDTQTYNLFRNSVVEVTHYYEKLYIPTLQYVMTSETFPGEISQQLNQERHVTFFKNSKDITNQSKTVLHRGELTMDMIGRSFGQYLSIDLTAENSDILALYVIKRFEPWLIPLAKCQSSLTTKISKHV